MAFTKEQLEQMTFRHNINYYINPIFTRTILTDIDLMDKIVNDVTGDNYTDVLIMELRYKDAVYVPEGVLDLAKRDLENTKNGRYLLPAFSKKSELPRRTLSIVEWIANLQKLGYTMKFEDAFNTFAFMDESSNNFEYINEYMEYIYNVLAISLGMDHKYIPFFHNFNDTSLTDDFDMYVAALYQYALYLEGSYVDEYGDEIDFYNRTGDIKSDVSTDETLESLTNEEIIAIMSDTNIGDYHLLKVTTNLHDLDQVFINLLGSNTTWSSQMHNDFVRYINTVYKTMLNRTSGSEWFLEWYDIPKIANKENLAFVTKVLLENHLGSALLTNSINNGRDILRIYASYSGADPSLATPPRFKNKLSGDERKFFMDLCLKVPHFYEDASRDAEMWKRAFERIHPERYGNQYEPVKKVAELIRKGHYAKTANSLIEEVVQKGSNNLEDFKAGLKFFEKFPSQFIRYFDSYVRHYGDKLSDDISENSKFKYLVSSELHEIVRSVESTKMLFQLLNYYGRKIAVNADDGVASRYIQLKGARKYTAIPAVTQNLCNPKYLIDFYYEIHSVIYSELLSRFHKLPWLGNVFIDPRVNGCTVPVNLRNASATGLQILAEGSTFACDPDSNRSDRTDFLYQPYIHWTNNKDGDHIDLDLSISFYSDSFKRIESVSYTNLHAYDVDDDNHMYAFALHSGDVRDGGPYDGDGVAETIIISRDGALRRGCKYAVVSVHSFNRQLFSETNCFFGFQVVASYTKKRVIKDSGRTTYLTTHYPKEINPKNNVFVSSISCESQAVATVLIDFERSLATWLDRDLFSQYQSMGVDMDDMYKIWQTLYAAKAGDDEENQEVARNYVHRLGINNVHTTALDEITQFKAAIEKPKMFCSDLLDIHVAARGVEVRDPALANLIFTLPDSPYAANLREDQELLTPFMVDRWIGEFLGIKDNE